MIIRVPAPALSHLRPGLRLAGPARPVIGLQERGVARAAARGRRAAPHTSASPLEELTELDRVEVAEAALAGWLQADGFVGQYEGTNRSLTIEFQVATDDEYEWVMQNLDVAFPEVHRKVREADTQHVRVRRIRLYGEVLREFVERWELLTRGTEMRVPPRLFTAPHDEIVAYLRSLFQADGYVTVHRDRHESARVGFAVRS